MAKTVIGLMDSQAEAQKVVQELLDCGFDRKEMRMMAGGEPGAVGLLGALASRGVPEDEAHFYAEGVRRGATLIALNAGNDELAMRGEGILQRQGAIDIKARAEEWKEQGWSGRFASKEEKERAAPLTEREREEPELAPVYADPVVPLNAVCVYSLVIDPRAGAYLGPNRRKHTAGFTGMERRRRG
jgi:hypothetical protein